MDFEKILNEKSFQEAVSNVNSIEELQAVLKEYNIEVTKEELEAALTTLPETGDLDEKSLEKVSGGINLSAMKATWGSVIPAIRAALKLLAQTQKPISWK